MSLKFKIFYCLSGESKWVIGEGEQECGVSPGYLPTPTPPLVSTCTWPKGRKEKEEKENIMCGTRDLEEGTTRVERESTQAVNKFFSPKRKKEKENGK